MEKDLERKANFFIVGTAKAGTTSVFNYLKEHKDVFTPQIKEPNYFAKIDTSRFSNTFKKNLPKNLEAVLNSGEEVQQAFISVQEDYDFLYKNCNKKVAIDSSTNYLHSQVAPSEIKKYNPKAKVLIILRNPYSRVLSHYNMAVKYGFTTRDFEEALRTDVAQKEKGVGVSEQFIELSLYSEAIKRYQEVFDNSQIRILFFEDLIKDKQSFINEVFKFLEIESLLINDEQVHNKGVTPRFKGLNKILTNLGIKRFVNSVLTDDLKSKVKSIYFSDKQKKDLTKEEKEILDTFFVEDIRKTKDLLPDLNFPW